MEVGVYEIGVDISGLSKPFDLDASWFVFGDAVYSAVEMTTDGIADQRMRAVLTVTRRGWVGLRLGPGAKSESAAQGFALDNFSIRKVQ